LRVKEENNQGFKNKKNMKKKQANEVPAIAKKKKKLK
jgi:hypothetical protein